MDSFVVLLMWIGSIRVVLKQVMETMLYDLPGIRWRWRERHSECASHNGVSVVLERRPSFARGVFFWRVVGIWKSRSRRVGKVVAAGDNDESEYDWWLR